MDDDAPAAGTDDDIQELERIWRSGRRPAEIAQWPDFWRQVQGEIANENFDRGAQWLRDEIAAHVEVRAMRARVLRK